MFIKKDNLFWYLHKLFILKINLKCKKINELNKYKDKFTKKKYLRLILYININFFDEATQINLVFFYNLFN
jgi:hypothetical protein